MSEKELIYQIISREVKNILISINPTFGMFSNIATNYVIQMIDPYIDAFANNPEKKINTKLAGEYAKQEINSKIDNFIKKFEAENNGM